MPKIENLPSPVALLLAALWLATQATPALASTITSVTATTSATLTQSSGGPGADDYHLSAAFSENCMGGCRNFTGDLQAAAGLEADTGENLRINVEWSYTVDIVVDAAATEAWELRVDLDLRGYLTLLDQGGGTARLRFTDVVGTLDAGGTGITGSMDLPGTNDVNTSSGANELLSRMGSFTVVGGFGPETVSMTFTMEGILRSRCTGGGCAGQGDEAAIRLGIESPPGFPGGSYPGLDLEDPADHGLFVAVRLPEPRGSWLLGWASIVAVWLLRRHSAGAFA